MMKAWMDTEVAALAKDGEVKLDPSPGEQGSPVANHFSIMYVY